MLMCISFLLMHFLPFQIRRPETAPLFVRVLSNTPPSPRHSSHPTHRIRSIAVLTPPPRRARSLAPSQSPRHAKLKTPRPEAARQPPETHRARTFMCVHVGPHPTRRDPFFKCQTGHTVVLCLSLHHLHHLPKGHRITVESGMPVFFWGWGVAGNLPTPSSSISSEMLLSCLSLPTRRCDDGGREGTALQTFPTICKPKQNKNRCQLGSNPFPR